jgi:hypothetical protein
MADLSPTLLNPRRSITLAGDFDVKIFQFELLPPPEFSGRTRRGSVGANAAVGKASADT